MCFSFLGELCEISRLSVKNISRCLSWELYVLKLYVLKDVNCKQQQQKRKTNKQGCTHKAVQPLWSFPMETGSCFQALLPLCSVRLNPLLLFDSPFLCHTFAAGRRQAADYIKGKGSSSELTTDCQTFIPKETGRCTGHWAENLPW